MVSSALGKLDVIRHLSSGLLCAIAGAARPAVAAAASPLLLMKLRRSMANSLRSGPAACRPVCNMQRQTNRPADGRTMPYAKKPPWAFDTVLTAGAFNSHSAEL